MVKWEVDLKLEILILSKYKTFKLGSKGFKFPSLLLIGMRKNQFLSFMEFSRILTSSLQKFGLRRVTNERCDKYKERN